jgi:glycosyltransferase involved in cell wall biosynthesis
MKNPLVSILVPAYNADRWIAETLQSALSQTWERKEIIVLNDGSRDRTRAIAEHFASAQLKVVSTDNQGSAAARNHALELSQGDYIQWLDADDLLAPDKIERQLAALRGEHDPQILLSGPWGFFNYRTRYTSFVANSLWNDLTPIEWLLRKMGENLHMQTATWLTSRELTEAAGPWDTRLQSDDDGEYFCRVLLASNGTRFVPEAKVFYRRTPSFNRVSYIGDSDDKKNSMIVSMKLHVQYLRSLEDSDRVRKACCTYLQTWFENFYPERSDLVAELQNLAAELHGHLEEPRLRWKFAWLKPIFGWKFAKRAQRVFPQMKSALFMFMDKLMYEYETRTSSSAGRATNTIYSTRKN